MSEYFAYEAILQSDPTEQSAIDFAMGYDWSEDQAQWQEIGYADHIMTINGVGVYYDYAADYYFFTDEIGEAIHV